MNKTIIQTDNAPKAIGPYSQAVRVNNTVYCSGQIGLDPKTMELVGADITAQVKQTLFNLQAVAYACEATLDNIVKLNVYLSDLSHWPVVNELMIELFKPPYPARAAFAVVQLPKSALVEMDAILEL